MKINISDNFKGYLAAITATLALSNVYIFSKAALQEVHLAQFGLYWFGMALIWNALYISLRKKKSGIRKITARQWQILVLTGLLEVASTTLFFSAISTVENPAIVSFIGNVGPVFVGLLGFVVLNERFNSIEIFGIILTLLGAFIISYRPNISFSDFYSEGIVFILASAFISSIATIITKKNIKNVEPIIFSTNRTLYLFVFSTIVFVGLDLNTSIPKTALFNITLGSLLGPFLAILASYVAMQFLEASRTSIIMSTKSLFVLVGAYLYFGLLAQEFQILGGLLTITGIIVITSGRKLKMRMQRKKQAAL